MKVFQKIRSVLPLADYSMLVCFDNGERKIFDVSKLFEKRVDFRALSVTDGLFKQLKVDFDGHGVRWGDELYLSCDELYKSGRSVPRDTSAVIYTPNFLSEDDSDEDYT